MSPWVLARPAAARPLDGVAAALAPSADGRHLYALNRTAGLLSRFDAATLAPAGELAVPAEAFALSPNGRHLAAAGGDKLWLIDPAAWRAGDPVRLRGRAYDVAVRDDGTAFVSEAAADWAEVTVIARGAVAARWAGAWGRSALRLSADGRRLYVAPQGVTPGTAEAWPLPADLAARPTPRAAEVPPTHPLGGEPTMTPDGRFLMWPTGTVLALSDRAGDDLKPAAKLAPFASAAADPAAGLAVAAGDDGVVRVYDYPSFRERSSFRPAGSAYRVAVAGRRLWLAAFDPAALRDRPRAAVPGELRAYVAPGP